MHPLFLLMMSIGITSGLERTCVEYRVFQFPHDRIPRIDGDAADWNFQGLSRKDRSVAFRDRSFDTITTWRWEFGDGKTTDDRMSVQP